MENQKSINKHTDKNFDLLNLFWYQDKNQTLSLAYSKNGQYFDCITNEQATNIITEFCYWSTDSILAHSSNLLNNKKTKIDIKFSNTYVVNEIKVTSSLKNFSQELKFYPQGYFEEKAYTKFEDYSYNNLKNIKSFDDAMLPPSQILVNNKGVAKCINPTPLYASADGKISHKPTLYMTPKGVKECIKKTNKLLKTQAKEVINSQNNQEVESKVL